MTRYEIELQPNRGFNRKLSIDGDVVEPDEARAMARGLADYYGCSIQLVTRDERITTEMVEQS